MKRIWASIFAFSVLLSGIFVLPVAAAVNDFKFRSFDADLYVSRDSEQRSVVRISEKLVAEFPDVDQNHGIERAIPEKYDGHPVSLHIISVTDEHGSKLHYTTYGSNDNLVIRIGDANTYVRGMKTYVIEYTARDVTKSFSSGDEFYWDVNGTEWQQPFESVSAAVHIDRTSVAGAYDGRQECFTGVQGSRESNCTMAFSANQQEALVSVKTGRLAAGENLSVVVGFHPNTFAGYKAPWWQLPLWYLLGLLAFIWYLVVPVVACMRVLKIWRRHGRDIPGRGTIVPQYTPPQGISVLTADVINGDRMRPKAVSAELVDLAVRGYVKIYQTSKREYELELVKLPTDLMPEEQEVVKMFFGSNIATGARIALKDKKNLYTQVAKLGKTVYERAITDGYMLDTVSLQRTMNTWGIVLLVISAFTVSLFGFIAGIITVMLAYHMPARSQKGIELKEYLLGTRDYMQLAEADRMKVLQSVQGAERINTSDNQQIVKLYERLLPLAMLFGIEKSWVNQFADLYQQPPDWYSGNWTAFNAGVLASSLNDFGSNTTTNSFSPPASSSSSGFSGGGSSGGGGGGGGGGGW